MFSFSAKSRFNADSRSSRQTSQRPTRPAGVPMACYKRMDTTDLEEPVDVSTLSEKEVQMLLKELYLRYKINMIGNAHLYNEKQALTYHVEDLQDQLQVETTSKQAEQMELKHWSKQVEDAKRRQLHIDQEISRLKSMIEQRDSLIIDKQLVMVAVPPPSDADDHKTEVEEKAYELLQSARLSPSSFDDKIKELVSGNERLKSQILDARKALSDEREDNLTKWRQPQKPSLTSSFSAHLLALKLKQQQELKKHQQAVTQANLRIDSLENQLLRLESQMHRYREVCGESDKVQIALKSDNHKINRQTEEANRQVEELGRICDHLQVRMEKVRTARLNALSALPAYPSD